MHDKDSLHGSHCLKHSLIKQCAQEKPEWLFRSFFELKYWLWWAGNPYRGRWKTTHMLWINVMLQHRESPHLPETLPYTNSSKLLYAPLCFNNSTAVRLKIMQSTCLTDQQGNLEDTGHFFKLWPMNEADEEVNFSETLFLSLCLTIIENLSAGLFLSSRHNLFNNSCVREHNFCSFARVAFGCLW